MEGMFFFGLWKIVQVTSLRLAQRRGFLGVTELQGASEIATKEAKKSKKASSGQKLEKQKSFSKIIEAQQKSKKNSRKGTSQSWKATVEVVINFTVSLWLTAVQDSKMCWRLDNFLGCKYTADMVFWDREEGAKSDVKKKALFKAPVVFSHQLFRNYMGAVDQRDVKSHVLLLTRGSVTVWHRKQLAFLCETAIINAYCNFNIDPSTTAEGFTEWHSQFVEDLLEMSRDYRKCKQRKLVTKESIKKSHKRIQHSKKTTKTKRRRKSSPYGTPTEAGLNCHGR